MVGSLKWNFMFSSAGMLLTLLFSAQNNPFFTALLRSIYCFIILFLIMFAIRWIFGTLIGVKPFLELEDDTEKQKGSNVDMSTPDEEALIQEALNESIESLESQKGGNKSDDLNQQGQFSPLNPPKLAKKEEMSAEKLADAVRHMTDEEGR